MGLRSALFRELAEFFAPNRLSVAFTSGARQFEPLAVGFWTLTATAASANVTWTAPTSVNLDGAKLFDGPDLVERFEFLDETGQPDYSRLLAGMKFDYSLTISLPEER